MWRLPVLFVVEFAAISVLCVDARHWWLPLAVVAITVTAAVGMFRGV